MYFLFFLVLFLSFFFFLLMCVSRSLEGVWVTAGSPAKTDMPLTFLWMVSLFEQIQIIDSLVI